MHNAVKTRPEAIRSESMVLTGAFSNDADHGRDVLGVHDVDKLILFGKTSASIDAPDMPYLEAHVVRINHQPVHAMRLPSLLSQWWHDPDNVSEATVAVADLLVKQNIPPRS